MFCLWAICKADNSGDEFVDAGSGSEAEELEDFNDEDEDDEGTQESAPNTSGAPQARLINNRGLKKSVDYVWLIGKLVNTAMDPNQGKEKAQRKGRGKDEAISIAEQEPEFVRQVDESSHGHAGNTQAAYKSTYRPYMEFCDKVYAEEGLKRYEVNAVKTARFLKEKLFPQSTHKNIPTHIIKDTKVFMHRSVIQNHGIPITGEGIQGTFDFALYLKEIEKKRPKKAAEQNKEGPLKPTQVMVPYGVSRISQAYSAIIHLWTLQTSRLRQRSEEPAIRPSGILKAENFEKDADGNIIKVGREVTTDSYATNYYSIQEHIKCLLYTWQQPVTARSSGMREHFNLAVRHAMLLRDEDLRRLNIANCTIDTLEQQLGGTQPIMAMVFSIHGGKTSQHGLRQEVILRTNAIYK
ncbi:hypothetical protein BGZ89_011299 [Linnemannia elongata]|nr:hypothetical protein BGZ89_011299 [Linnemannia elongata]